ncbi:hypothetical protein ACLESO_23535 [Pyxidicoccus sp. 3LG]
MRVVDAFSTVYGQVYGLWPHEEAWEVQHFIFEADARRLVALAEAVRSFERTADVADLLDYLSRERPGFDRALDEVRGPVLASVLEDMLREDGDARAAWLDVRDAVWVRSHRYTQLWCGLRRLRRLMEERAALEVIRSEADALGRLVREPPAPGALVQTARTYAEAGQVHEVLGLCLQTALLPEASDLGLGVLLSLDLHGNPCPLPRTLISPASEVAHVSALLSDGLHEDLGAITWGAGEDLAQVARGLGSASEYTSTVVAPALARMGARGACAVSFTGWMKEKAR